MEPASSNSPKSGAQRLGFWSREGTWPDKVGPVLESQGFYCSLVHRGQDKDVLEEGWAILFSRIR